MSAQHFFRYFLPASALVAAGVAWLVARTDDCRLEGAYAVVGLVLSALVWRALIRAAGHRR